MGLPPSRRGPRQVQHLGRLHVGEGPEHLLEFRQVGEAGEPASRPQARAVRGDFHRVDDFAEGGRPGVEMLQPTAPQPFGVEESLHRVHLDHRVGNRRAGGERHAVAGVLLVEVTGFHVHVEGPLGAAGLDAGDALHLGRRLQVLEVMGLVDEDVIDAEFVEHQPVILLVLGEQVLQAFGPRRLLLLDGLDEIAVGTLGAGVFAEQLVVFGDLLQEELLLVVPRHADPLEAAMGDDDAVPLAAGDLGGQELAAVAGQILLGGDEQPGVGVELHELAGELLQQVIGDDVHRLLDEAGLLHLHAGGGHREGLAGADGVGQQRVAGTHAAPDGVVLVGPQPDGLVHAGKVEVRAVEQAGPQIVVGVVVNAAPAARCARDR